MPHEIKSRIKKQRVQFTQISNALLESVELSLKAKGLYSYMFSKPDNWNFTIKSMAKQLKEGTTSIANALKELKDNGWVEYIKYSDGTGEYFLLTEQNVVDKQNTQKGSVPTKEETPHQPQSQSQNKRTSDTDFRKFLYELKNALPNKYKLKIKDISINSKNDSLEAIENNDIAYNSWIKLSKKYSTKEIIETFVKYTEVEDKNSNGRYVKNIVNFLINYDEVKKSAMSKEQLKPLAVEYLNGTIEDYETGDTLDWLVKKSGIKAVEAKYHIVGVGKYLEAELKRRGLVS